MKLSVESEALVMPSSSGRPLAGWPAAGFDPLVLFVEAEFIHLLFQQEFGIADFLDLDPAHHLAHDHFDVLVVDVDALQPVDLLDLIDEVALQFLFTQHAQNVVRIARTVHQGFAGPDILAFLNVDVHAARQQVFFDHAAFVVDFDLALAADQAAIFDRCRRFR